MIGLDALRTRQHDKLYGMSEFRAPSTSTRLYSGARRGIRETHGQSAQARVALLMQLRSTSSPRANRAFRASAILPVGSLHSASSDSEQAVHGHLRAPWSGDFGAALHQVEPKRNCPVPLRKHHLSRQSEKSYLQTCIGFRSSGGSHPTNTAFSISGILRF